jgi:SAM-dependent methyltransferase
MLQTVLPMELEAYAEMAAVEDAHWWFRGRRAVLRDTIRRLNPAAGIRILELGSGTGGNLKMLAAFGAVTAVELNDDARALSLSKAGATRDVRAGSLPNDLPLDDETFDLICLFDVLEHIDDDEATLAVIGRHLAPGGTVIITVPAFKPLWGPHDVALHHKRRYAKSELAAKIAAAGFLASRLTFFNTALFAPALLVRLADRLRRPGKAAGTKTPGRIVNEILAAVFSVERFPLRWIDLPFGLSLLAVLKRSDAKVTLAPPAKST